MKLSTNFTTEEARCRCGCGFGSEAGEYPQDFVRLVQAMREIKGGPIWVNSWGRCQRYNAAVGGVEGSAHTRLSAVDLGASYARDRYNLIILAVMAALSLQMEVPIERWRALFYTISGLLRGIGVGKGFVHIDDDFISPRPAAWGYGSDGGGG